MASLYAGNKDLQLLGCSLVLNYNMVKPTQKPVVDMLCYVYFWKISFPILWGNQITLQFGNQTNEKSHMSYKVQPWYTLDPVG